MGDQVRSLMQPNQLTRAVSDGRVIRLWRDCYSLPECAADLSTRLAAADLTIGKPLVACLGTAASLHGFAVSTDQRLHLLAPARNASHRETLTLHRFRSRMKPVRVSGRLAVHPVETALRLACMHSPADALAHLDAALRTGVSKTHVRKLAARVRWGGIGQARRLVELADAAAESPGESRLRWTVLNAGLPAPVPQYVVRVRADQSFRLDLAWPDRRIGCEYDGVAFHTGDRLFADRARLNALAGQGWTIIHVTAAMLTSELPTLIAQLRTLLLDDPYRH